MDEEPQVVESPPPVIQPELEPTIKKNIKTVELVTCPKCNKKLTERTLKYTHQDVCPANENKIKKEKVKHTEQVRDLEQEDNHPHLQKVKRLHVRSERYKNLITNAF